MVIGVFIIVIGLNSFCIDAIKPHHLFTYLSLILICYVLLDKSNKFSNKDVICLSFLIVFINSEYWEFPYRFFKIVNWEIDKNDIQQLAHLLPFYGLTYTFDYRRECFKPLIKGCLFTFITSTIRIFLLQKIFLSYMIIYMMIQRIGALYFLTRFYIISKKVNGNDNS